MKIDKQILEKYFKGHCSEEEAAFVDAYLQGDVTPEMDEWMAAAWKETDEATVEQATGAVVKEMPRKGIFIYKHWYNIAAAVAVLVTISTWLWQTSQGRLPKATALAFRWDTLANNGNNIKLVSLSDGSKVWLAPHTSLAYSYHYNDTSRELWLNGEAYFEVAQDNKRPFSVHTGKLTTTALGTAFNIATGNRADGSIEVSLVEGKVAVKAVTSSWILNPGEMLSYHQETLSTKPQRFDVREVLDWRQGKLVFNGVALEDAFMKLQSRFGCRIETDGTVPVKKKISGVFPAGQPLERILDALQYVHGFTITKKSDTIYLITTKRHNPEKHPL